MNINGALSVGELISSESEGFAQPVGIVQLVKWQHFTTVSQQLNCRNFRNVVLCHCIGSLVDIYNFNFVFVISMMLKGLIEQRQSISGVSGIDKKAQIDSILHDLNTLRWSRAFRKIC